MRITIVQGAFLPIPPWRGGATEKIWFALGKEFARRGHAVTHISRRFSGLPEEEDVAGVQHLRIQGHDSPRSLIALKFFDLLYSLRVARRLPAADILVTNTFWLPAFMRSGKAGALYVHVARYPRGQMRFYRHAARVQTVTRPIVEAILAEAPALAGRVSCIPNPVVRSLPDEPPAASTRRHEILYVGRIHPEKGLHLLIGALLRLPREVLADWRLVIVGPASISAGGGGKDYEAELKRLAQPLGDRVAWIGPVFDPVKLDEFYLRASLFVYPSIAERGETFGVSPLEAMAYGCAPLVSKLACFRDFIDEDVNGFVFDHRAADPAGALAAKLTQILPAHEVLAQAGESAGRKARGYSVEQIAAQYLEDFQSLCGHGKDRAS